ncbi:MAG: cation transporter [Lachnospiraceae bacterium]|nr:cation transporter [Lachnospiraceae bacterium]
MSNEHTQKKYGTKTLLWSVIMSAPGPLIIGLGLFVGRSSTQIADFVRRSSELLAIIMAYVVYKITTKDGICDTVRKDKLERFSNLFVGAMMCLGGSLMLLLAFVSENEDKGNVIPGLAIALLGVIANTIFWRKYTKLNKQEPNAILAVQARLYRAKSLVDSCVTIALLSVVLFPTSTLSYYLDLIGSVIVALYLIWCGIQTIFERLKK